MFENKILFFLILLALGGLTTAKSDTIIKKLFECGACN